VDRRNRVDVVSPWAGVQPQLNTGGIAGVDRRFARRAEVRNGRVGPP
jgi:hypothetical protein